MKITNQFLLFILSLLLCGVSFGDPYGAGPQTVRVGIFPFAPLNFMDDDGSAQGLYPDLLRKAVSGNEEMKLEFVPITWAEGLKQLQSKEIDLMVSVAHTTERAQSMDYNSSPVLEVWGQVFAPKNTSFDTVSDLAGKRVGIMRKDISGDNFIKLMQDFNVECEIVQYATHDDVFTAIKNGEIDAGVAAHHFGIQHTEKHGLKGTLIQFSPFPVYFAAKKGEQQDLLSHIDSHLIRWKQKKNSFYYHRRSYWVEGYRGWATTVPLWLWISAGTLIGIALFLIVATRHLKLQVKKRSVELESFFSHPMGIHLITDFSGKMIRTNSGWTHSLGYTNDELEGHYFMDWVHPDDQEATIKQMTLLEEGERVLNFENRYRHKNGSYRMLIWAAVPDPDSDRIHAIAQDVTESQALKDAIISSEEKFRALYENAPMPYQSLDEDGCFLDMNPAWLRTLGYERDEMIGARYADLLHPDWKPHFEKNFPAFKKRGYVSDVQFKIRHKEGHFLDIAFEGCIGLNPDGSFRQTYCVFQDITARKQAEEALIENEQRYRKAQRMGRVGNWEFDPIREKFWASDEAKRIFGFDPNSTEISIEEAEKCIPERERTHQALFDLIEKGKPYKLEYEIHPMTGTQSRIISSVAELSKNNTDSPVKVVGLIQDISERKQTEMELSQNTAILRESQKLARLGNWSMDIPTQQLTWSDELYSIFEITPGTPLTYDLLLERVHPEDRAYHDQLTEQLMSEGPTLFEYRVLLPNGDIRWVSGQGGATFNPEEEPIVMSGILQDITELKAGQEALLKSRDELELRVEERTKELRQIVNAMAGREIRMAELKEIIKTLCSQLEDAGMTPPESITKSIEP